MSTFVLVHGAWHGGWCWRKVVPYLEAVNHRVLAPDQAGLGDDQTPLAGATLERWTRDLCALIERQPGRVMLVGHSRGGLLISQAAERMPERIEMLVYLSALLIKDGQAGREALRSLGHSPLQDFVVPNGDGLSVTVRDEGIRASFYGRCLDEDFAFAQRRLRPEPMAPAMTPIKVSAENFGRVRRAYIECTQDRAILPPIQRAMYTSTPCERVLSIDADHSPFFSAPGELAQRLMSLLSPTAIAT